MELQTLPEKSVRETMKVKPMLQWSPQNFEDYQEYGKL